MKRIDTKHLEHNCTKLKCFSAPKPPMKKERCGKCKNLVMPCTKCTENVVFNRLKKLYSKPKTKVVKKTISKENYELGVLSNREDDFPSPYPMKKEKKQDLSCPNGYPDEGMKCCRCVRPQYPKVESKECRCPRFCEIPTHKLIPPSVRISKLEDDVVDYLIAKHQVPPVILDKLNQILDWINSQK